VVLAPAGLAISVRGRGPDVVLVHGVLGDYRQWAPIARRLSRRYRVSAVSRRFHWPNPPPVGSIEYTYEAQAADLDAMLQSLGQAHVVGHSYGAGVALLTALRHPEAVRSLILIEPPFGSVVPPSTPDFASELASRNSVVAALLADVQSGAAARAAEALIDWVQGMPGSFRRLPRDIQNGLRANAPTLGPTFAAQGPVVTCTQLHALRVPVLVLRGERTRPWYRIIAVATSDCIPDAQAAVVPAARHMGIVENPNEFATLIAGFLHNHEE